MSYAKGVSKQVTMLEAVHQVEFRNLLLQLIKNKDHRISRHKQFQCYQLLSKWPGIREAFLVDTGAGVSLLDGKVLHQVKAAELHNLVGVDGH